MSRTINSAGLAIIRDYEGFRPKAYLCPAGVWTIGYGTTRYPNGEPVKDGDTCTPDQAEVWLENHLVGVENTISKAVKVPISDNAFSALCSLVYNIGSGLFLGSTLLKRINEGAPDGLITTHMKAFIFAGGKQLPGLVKRRAAEAALWGMK
jgi:lysozyme